MVLRFSSTVFALSATLLAQEPAPFRAEVNLVNLAVIVRSSAGTLISDLQKQDFEIIEDGKPQTIRYFARQTDLPLSLGLLVDASGSQEHFLKKHTHDVDRFLSEVIRPGDQAFALCFGNHLRLVSDFTSSRENILSGLHRYAKGDYDFPEVGPAEERDLGTAFYDAIYFPAVEKMRQARSERRAFLMFSDGEDNSSEHDLLDAIRAAQDTNVLVYCIRYTHQEHGRLNARNRYGIRVMRDVGNQTGARDFDGTAENLRDVFASIGEELRCMYEIGYLSSNKDDAPQFRKVTVRCLREDTVTRAKSGYYSLGSLGR